MVTPVTVTTPVMMTLSLSCDQAPEWATCRQHRQHYRHHADTIPATRDFKGDVIEGVMFNVDLSLSGEFIFSDPTLFCFLRF